MSPGRRVAVTGVSSHWGAELARRLERDPRISYLAGIDSRPPPAELQRTDFIEADIRSVELSRLLPATSRTSPAAIPSSAAACCATSPRSALASTARRSAT